METIGQYEYSSKDLIGHGAFAVVYRGRVRTRPNQTVAIKAITKKNLAKSQNLLSKEIKILKELTELQHDNVVALLDCKETSNHVYLVMEYCNGGDLADYLNAKGTLSEDTIQLFLRQLAGAIAAMVSKDIVHRDLKPQNILLSHDGKTRNPKPEDIKLKIADFGFARFLQDGVMAATLCGSPMYMAPEVIMSLQYNSKADLWSLGTIVFQCLTGKAPFQAQTPQALKHFYEKNNSLTPKIPSGTSKELTDLLLGLLKRNAKDRFEFDVFFNHPFLNPPKSNGKQGLSQQENSRPLTLPAATSPAPQTAASNSRKSPAPASSDRKSTPPGVPKNQSPSEYSDLPPSPVPMTRLPTTVLGHGNSGSPAAPPNACSSGSPKINPVVIAPTKHEFFVPSPSSKQANTTKESSGSSPDACDDFVMVPEDLTRDSAEVRKLRQQPINKIPASRRHTVAGSHLASTATAPTPGTRPTSLPVAQAEPQPVPAQRSNFQQMQQSLVRSRSRSGDSVSAMSGVSSASGGSTLGPLPEETVAPSSAPSGPSPALARRARAFSAGSPSSSPSKAKNTIAGTQVNNNLTKIRKISSTMPDICQMSPPTYQFTMGTPPLGHRRRTSSSSSCGTPPPNLQWALTPNPTAGRIGPPAISPIRNRSSSGSSNPSGSQTNLFTNIPCLSPILGSPNKVNAEGGGVAVASAQPSDEQKAVIPWVSSQSRGQMSGSRTVTVPENLCNLGSYTDPTNPFRRRSGDFQFLAGRNVVVNYGQQYPLFQRSGSFSSLTRKHSGTALVGKENLAPFDINMPPPDLSEETLLAPEHNEILAKLRFINQYVDTIIEVARCKAAPLTAVMNHSIHEIKLGEIDPNSSLHRRVQQLLLYMRCLHLLSQCLDFARTELKSKRLKPSTNVKNVLATLNERFRHCLSMTKMLNSENLLNSCGLDPHSSAITADRILYQYAIEQCQSAALDELFGNPGECFQRYHSAHILLHALEQHSQCVDDKSALTKYRDAVEKRLTILSDQGFVTAYETISH